MNPDYQHHLSCMNRLIVAPTYQVAPNYQSSIDLHQVARAFTKRPYLKAPHYQVAAPHYQVAPHETTMMVLMVLMA